MAASPVNPYQNTTNPTQAAANQRYLNQVRADQLNSQNDLAYAQGNQQTSATQDYLNQIENPIAQGQGGYNASEVSNIELSPAQQQQMVTGAGISAGANTAAATDAAQRATNAAGGNPAALAAYRARAASNVGAQAGDAQTQARIAAQQANAAATENVGQTRLGQQNQAVNYYTGLQAQQNQNAQNSAQRQNTVYGSETGAGNTATQNTVTASQLPTTFDKAAGLVSGIASNLLEDGDVATTPTLATIGENGPEAVVPVDTGFTPMMGPTTPAKKPFDWKAALQRIRAAGSNPQGPASAGQQPASSWNPTTPYQQIGKVAGTVAGKFLGLEDGGVVTNPTKAIIGEHGPEMVVPLSYKANSKVRPSAVMPALKKGRSFYGESAA